MDLSKLGITPGELKIRTQEDDSGDYVHKTYDIMAHYPWGARCLIGDIDNPNDARLFKTSPKMLKILIDLCLEGNNCQDCPGWRNCKLSIACLLKIYAEIIEEVADMSWEEVKRILATVKK